MASAADKAEQRVHDQRRLIEQKLADLEARVKEDVSAAQTTTRERTQNLAESIPGRHRIEREVEQRPLTTLAVGLAAGVGLGMLSDSISLGVRGGHRTRQPMYDRSMERGRDGDGGGIGMMSQLLAPATAALVGPLQSQLQEFVSSALAGLSRGGEQRHEDRAMASGQLQSERDRRGSTASAPAAGAQRS